VPRGIEHRTAADEEAEVILLEPAGVRNTGTLSTKNTRPPRARGFEYRSQAARDPRKPNHSIFPGESRGPSFPPHEPVIAVKTCSQLEKFEAAEAWIPAFAGTAKAEVANFSNWSGYLPSLGRETHHVRIRPVGFALPAQPTLRPSYVSFRFRPCGAPFLSPPSRGGG
jgi:hypothetical protein